MHCNERVIVCGECSLFDISIIGSGVVGCVRQSREVYRVSQMQLRFTPRGDFSSTGANAQRAVAKILKQMRADLPKHPVRHARDLHWPGSCSCTIRAACAQAPPCDPERGRDGAQPRVGKGVALR